MFSTRNIQTSHRVDKKLGTFRPRSQIGMATEIREKYNGWTLTSWGTRVGLTKTRERFSLRISDPQGLAIKNLSGFASREQALDAGREWIDRAMHGAEVRRRRTQTIRAGRRR